METMIVEVAVPAINKTFDFQLPAAGIVRDVLAEMIRILSGRKILPRPVSLVA